jgi:hypothetical protein
VRIRVGAIGLNRAEIIFREGEYLLQPVSPAAKGSGWPPTRSPGRV